MGILYLFLYMEMNMVLGIKMIKDMLLVRIMMAIGFMFLLKIMILF